MAEVTDHPPVLEKTGDTKDATNDNRKVIGLEEMEDVNLRDDEESKPARASIIPEQVAHKSNGNTEPPGASTEGPEVPPKDEERPTNGDTPVVSVSEEVVSISSSSAGPSTGTTTPSNNTLAPDTGSSRRRSRRSPSVALSVSSTASGHQTVSSMVFIKKALDAIKNSKDARRISALDNAVSKAMST
jgi:hypothetical protein